MSDFDEERMDIIGQNGNDGAIYDEVSRPRHYRLFPDMQAIDVIMATLSPAEFEGYLKGNILKYRLRAGNKGDAQKDIAKADWYSNKLIEFVGANNG